MFNTFIPTNRPFTNYSDIVGVVAVEHVGPFMRLFIRNGAMILHEDIPFNPFLLAMQPVDSTAQPVHCRRIQLNGPGEYRWLIICESWQDCCLLQSHLSLVDKKHPTLFVPDPCRQFLLTSGISFYKGLSSDAMPVTFLSSGTIYNKDGAVFQIALLDNMHGETLLSTEQMPERMMFEQLSELIQDQDPDILAGHGISRQIPELVRRAKEAGARLNWGRDGSAPHLYKAENYKGLETHCHLFGRSVLDLRYLVQRLHLDQPTNNYAEPLRSALHPDVEDLTNISASPLQQVNKDRKIYRLLLPSFMQLAEIAPFHPQSAIAKDNTELLNSLILGEYLKQGSSLPLMEQPLSSPRLGSDRLLRQGIYGPVAHCEIRALFPSILLAYRLAPKKDHLGAFLKLLQQLTALKRKARTVVENPLSAEQFTIADISRAMFASLAGASQAMLASSRSPFADHHAAAEADRLASVLTADLLGWLRQEEADPLALGKDGIYFIPPPGDDGTAVVARLVGRLKEILPVDVTLSCDAVYRAMLCYKPGNFALLGNDDRLYLHGSSMKAGNLEPFMQSFLHGALRLLLSGRPDEVSCFYAEQMRLLKSGKIPVSWLAKTETIPVSPEQYRREVQAGNRHHNAACELALRSSTKLHAGERIKYYVTGYDKSIKVYENCNPVSRFNPEHPDINLPWYIEKLRHVYLRLSPFLPDRSPLH